MKLKLSLVLLVAAPLLLKAQEKPLEFSLAEAQEYALEHNKTLKNARADVKLAQEAYKEARGAGLPSVEGSMEYMTNFNYEFELNFGGGASEPPQINYAALDEGDYEVLDAINQMFGSSSGSAIVMEDQASANLQVSQLIFSGQYWIGLQMARLAESVRETSLTLTELDIKEQVANSYYLILITKQLLTVLEKNTDNLNELYTHTNNMYKNGLTEQTDVDQIKINLSLLKNSKNQMERNLQLNFNMFKLLMGIPTHSKISLTEDLESFVNLNESILNKADTFNVSNNLNYKLMEKQVEMSNKQVDMQKWAYSPTLVGFYSYKEKILTSEFDLTPKNAAGLTLSVPIFSGGIKKAQLSQKKIEYDKSLRNKNLIEEQLLIQEKQLSYEFKNAFDNYLTQKENVEVAKRVYQSYQNKYKQGLASSMELVQANSNYLTAESNYTSAILKVLQSKLALNKLHNNI